MQTSSNQLHRTMLSLLNFITLIFLTTAPSEFAAAANDTYNILAGPNFTKPGCPARCGNLTIPYPFGIGIGGGCGVATSFEINCSGGAAFLRDFQIHDISDNHIRTSNCVARKCYDKFGSIVHNDITSFNMTGTTFALSDLNKFILVGCNDFGVILSESGLNLTCGCISVCTRYSRVADRDCSGRGCCRTSLPKGLQFYAAGLGDFNNISSPVWSFNPCSYVFLGEEGSFVFRNTDLSDPDFMNRVETTVPLLLDWSIGNLSCAEVVKSENYGCKSNSLCVDSTAGLGGYRCSCYDGYGGNPYLDPGCTDINECSKSTLNDCANKKYCKNSVGSYSCYCPHGLNGDGRKNGTGCSAYRSQFPVIKLALGGGLGFVLIVIASTTLIYLYMKRRRSLKLKESFLHRNGGFLLDSLKRDSIESTKLFTAEELEEATNNYADDRIVGRGGYGTVYKGILPDNCVIAVKKSTVMDQSQIEQFINEVVILMQINHRNVVKLLGCCLETEVPFLVYEYISNGTLFQHIQNGGATNWLSWEHRLRIAAEAAGALSYLHSAASIPIIHRDVKSTNILLDQHHTSKISDFGASRLIPLDRTQVTTKVVGTFGYLDPEYFQSYHLTDKSDVYSFGVVLAELLTGRKPVDMERSEEQHGLTLYFIKLMQENRLWEIVEPRVVREGSVEQIETLAELINRCLRPKREDRPTMREVVTELEALTKDFDWAQKPGANEESVCLTNEIQSGESSGQHSSSSSTS